jgi:hypothetical protein
MPNNKLNHDPQWQLGYAYGLLDGISMRPDVPQEVRDICRQAVKNYKVKNSPRNPK